MPEPRNTIRLLHRSLSLQTRLSNHIINHQDRTPAHDGTAIALADLKKKYSEAIHRPVGPCATYNCHGLTFGSRRTQILAAQEVAWILEEDEYNEIPLQRVMPGDVAVYFAKGTRDAEHSGIVVHVDDYKVPWILSKWGAMHEAIHKPTDCEYDSTDVKYYRVCE